MVVVAVGQEKASDLYLVEDTAQPGVVDLALVEEDTGQEDPLGVFVVGHRYPLEQIADSAGVRVEIETVQKKSLRLAHSSAEVMLEQTGSQVEHSR